MLVIRKQGLLFATDVPYVAYYMYMINILYCIIGQTGGHCTDLGAADQFPDMPLPPLHHILKGLLYCHSYEEPLIPCTMRVGFPATSPEPTVLLATHL